MEISKINNIDEIINQASIQLAKSQEILKKLLEDEDGDSSSSGDFTIENAQILQLILQYRLDTQDALIKLLQLDNSLLQILGISRHHAPQINMERMKYALGNDDLRHILHALSQLVNSLLRIAYHYQQSLHKDSKPKIPQKSFKNAEKYAKVERQLQAAITHQIKFSSLIEDIQYNLDEWNKLAAIGPIYDHIAAYQGPISHFFQALQNGFEVTHSIYQKTYTEVQLENNLGNLLHLADNVLKNFPPIYQPQHFFKPLPNPVTPERLEQRATAKRLGNFFRYQ